MGFPGDRRKLPKEPVVGNAQEGQVADSPVIHKVFTATVTANRNGKIIMRRDFSSLEAAKDEAGASINFADK